MNSRERLIAAINHIEPDRPPVDLGATTATGMAVSTMNQFRRLLGLEDHILTAFDPFQMLGWVEDDLGQKVGTDVVALMTRGTKFGYKNDPYKEWTMPDGLKVLVGEGFEVDYADDGSILLYPQGDRSAAPSGKMPSNGYFFDILTRQEEFDEDDLDARRDYAGQYGIISDEDARELEEKSKKIFDNTEYGIIATLPCGSLGSAGNIPGAAMKRTPGIRSLDEFFMAHYLYPEYVHDLFAYETETAIENLKKYREAVGNRIQAIWVSGTDFGTQNSEMISPDMWREFYKPYYAKLNGWVHENTDWKVFFHSCGSIPNLLEDMIDCGVDIINPVQCSAAGMEAEVLKKKFGDRITFWGGGIDTQKVLPYGTPEEVFAQAQERLRIFSKGGGYVFSSIHNIVARVPAENVRAFYNAYRAMYGLEMI